MKGYTRDFRAALNDAMSAYGLSYALKLLLPEDSYVMDIYNSYFVYETYVPGVGFRYYKRTYRVNSSGQVKIGSDVQAVRPVTQYLDVENSESGITGANANTNTNTNTEGNTMDTKEKVDKLINSDQTRFEEGQCEELTALDDNILDMMLKGLLVPTPTGESTSAASTAAPAPAPAPAPQANEQMTVEKYLEGAPVEVRAVLNRALSGQQARRDELENSLKGLGAFTETELGEMDIDMLEKMARISKVSVRDHNQSSDGNLYIGMPIGSTERSLESARGNNGMVPLPPSIFERSDSASQTQQTQ